MRKNTGLLNPYSQKNIYKVDKAGLVLKCLPDRTHDFKGDRCNGNKCSKERINIMPGINITRTNNNDISDKKIEINAMLRDVNMNSPGKSKI